VRRIDREASATAIRNSLRARHRLVDRPAEAVEQHGGVERCVTGVPDREAKCELLSLRVRTSSRTMVACAQLPGVDPDAPHRQVHTRAQRSTIADSDGRDVGASSLSL